MKTIGTAAVILAFANLLAIVCIVGFLHASDRLSIDRIKAIKEILTPTVPEDLAKVESEKGKSEQEAKAAADTVKMAIKPEPAADAVDSVKMADDIRQQQLMRLREEIRQLQAQQSTRQTELETARAALAAKEAQFQQRLAEMGKAAVDAQFKQALAALEAQEPADAKKVLQALIDTSQREQAISYLASMGSKSRAAVLTEFITADERLAAGLLEQLRTRGLITAAPGTTPAAPTTGRP